MARRRRSGSSRYHSHPSHPYSHIRTTKHLSKSGGRSRRRPGGRAKRSKRTGRFIRG